MIPPEGGRDARRPEAAAKLGLIGCGRIAQLVHLKAMAALDNIAITAIAESDPSRLDQAHTMAPLAAAYGNYRDLLQDPNVEGVVVALPPSLHASCAIDAFQAGKDVYLEKPIALNLREADGVLHAQQQSGRIGMIGFNFRFNALYREARAKIQSGTLGRLVAARTVFSAAARTIPAWKRSRRTGGGVLLDLASHHFDLVRFLFEEEIVSVRATTRSQMCDGDTATVEMQLRSGLLVQSFFSMGAIEEHKVEIYGNRGKLSFDRVPSLEVTVTRPQMPYDRIRRIWDAGAALNPRRLFRGPSEPSFSLALQEFARGCLTRQNPAPDLMDGYRSLQLVCAAEAAAAEIAVQTGSPAG